MRGLHGAGAFWLAFILTFSPWEKEEPSEASGFAEERFHHSLRGLGVPFFRQWWRGLQADNSSWFQIGVAIRLHAASFFALGRSNVPRMRLSEL